MAKKPETKLRRLFEAAVSRAHPDNCMDALAWPVVPGRIAIVGAGKAAAAMAVAVESKDYPFDEGLAITQYGARLETQRIEVVEARHPVPDESGVQTTNRILNMAQSLGEDDALVVLLSGGGSSLLGAPREPIALSEKQRITKALLASGATIDELNCVRKHLSKVKGGQLAAAAYPAACVTFAISDVAGDEPSTIASGPTVPDPTSFEDAVSILRKYRVETSLIAQVDERFETPKPNAIELSKQSFELIATPQDALNAAAHAARELGLHPIIISDRLEGTVRELAHIHAERIAAEQSTLTQGGAPLVLLSGGEATVDLRNGPSENCQGGPNQEFALELARILSGAPGINALSADTDGRDGNSNAAGAFIGPKTLSAAKSKGLSVEAAIERHASTSFFEMIGASFVTGPTHTNVNDFRAILIDPAETS